MNFTQLSPRRKALRVLAVTLAILGGVTILYAVFVMESYYYYFDPGPGREPSDSYIRTYQNTVGFVGVVLIFLAYMTYRFIPSSERET